MSASDVPQSDFFSSPQESSVRKAPLADRLRPQEFSEFVGQDSVLGEYQPLRRAIETDQVPSLILWGPSGSGKTTLAGIIARKTQAVFVKFSAVVSGIPELRSVIKASTLRHKLSGQPTILFVDEIHRFNKAQQDAFLPYVEHGEITLIGATTQNPSFEIIAPLLSRLMVVVLQPLDDIALGRIIDHALLDSERGLGKFGIALTSQARTFLIRFGNSDARVALTALEYAVNRIEAQEKTRKVIDRKYLESILPYKSLRYDKDGEEHYNLISAYIKSLRDSDANGALYWLARMLKGGEDPKFIARRMIIFSSEDIGNANPLAVVVATAVFHAVEVVGLPEAQINLAHGTTFLASCPKSNASYVGLLEAMGDVTTAGNLEVPFHLRNAVTSLMKDLDYGKGYRYVHADPKARSEQTHLPEELKDRIYYRAGESSQDEKKVKRKKVGRPPKKIAKNTIIAKPFRSSVSAPLDG